MSDLLTRFAAIRRAAPARALIHLPGVGAEWTADDVWDAHQRYAGYLRHAGVSRGQLVISAAGNSPASVAWLLACRAVDAAMLPADAGTPAPELAAMVQRFGAAALLLPATTDARDVRVAAGSPASLDAGLRLAPTLETERRCYPGSAVLRLTSGSTGAARAALTSEAQLVADATSIIDAMDIGPADVQIAAIPLSHAYGLGNLVLPLLLQGTAIVLRESFVPHQLPADARRCGARVFPGVPFMFQFFVANPPADGWPPALSRLISAGAPLPPATLRAFHDRFGVKIHSFYGASETGGIAFDADDEVDDSGTVGRPLPGVTITLREDGGEGGRIHVASAAVAGGYTDGDQDAFVDGGFLTGDCGAWDARRKLAITGRASPFINVAGRKVQPDEVERVLREMPGISDARVLAAADPRRGEQIVACVVADRIATALAVRRFCAARLAPHKIPRAIVFVDAIPLTARGKTDRPALERLVRARLEEMMM